MWIIDHRTHRTRFTVWNEEKFALILFICVNDVVKKFSQLTLPHIMALVIDMLNIRAGQENNAKENCKVLLRCYVKHHQNIIYHSLS